MAATMIYGADVCPTPGTVVAIAPELAATQAPDGSMVPGESLGPGIVRRVEHDGHVWVHWVGADFDSCLDCTDVSSPGQDAHLVSVYRHAKDGRTTLRKHIVVTGAGLEHNWTVELWPSNIVRTIRSSDRAAWTFTYDWVFSRIQVWWPQPPDDEDAEALVAAEAAAKVKR